MIAPGQGLITPGELAKELGVSRWTLAGWASRLAPARWSRGYYKVATLRMMNVLPAESAQETRTTDVDPRVLAEAVAAAVAAVMAGRAAS